MEYMYNLENLDGKTFSRPSNDEDHLIDNDKIAYDPESVPHTKMDASRENVNADNNESTSYSANRNLNNSVHNHIASTSRVSEEVKLDAPIDQVDLPSFSPQDTLNIPSDTSSTEMPAF